MAYDADILAAITRLVDEEHALRSGSTGGPQHAGSEGQQRLRTIEVELDRCWDLLRQRRARRAFGVDPGTSAAREAAVVEHYLQ